MRVWSLFLFFGISCSLELFAIEETTPFPLGTADLEGAFDQAAKAYVQPAAVDLDAVKWEGSELGLAQALEIASAAVPGTERIQSIERLQLDAGEVGYYAAYGYEPVAYTTRALQADGSYLEEERHRYQKVGVLIGPEGKAVTAVPENKILRYRLQSPEAATRVVPQRRVLSRSEVPEKQTSCEITVTEDGLQIDGELLDEARLDARLKEVLKGTKILVRAPAHTPHREVTDLVSRLSKAGLDQVSFAIYEPQGDEAQAQAPSGK